MVEESEDGTETGRSIVFDEEKTADELLWRNPETGKKVRPPPPPLPVLFFLHPSAWHAPPPPTPHHRPLRQAPTPMTHDTQRPTTHSAPMAMTTSAMLISISENRVVFMLVRRSASNEATDE